MGLETLDPNYSEGQFSDALQQLLPPGEYWNHNGEPSELKQVLDGLGAELKAVHDETKLNFLFEIDNSLLGWKVSDFQAVLDQSATSGSAFDDPNYPNIIFILLEQTTGFLATMQQLQAHRLPHTQINWKLAGVLGTKGVLRWADHFKLDLTEAPYLGGLAFEAAIRPITYIRLVTQEG